jgi:hypothetical protein
MSSHYQRDDNHDIHFIQSMSETAHSYPSFSYEGHDTMACSERGKGLADLPNRSHPTSLQIGFDTILQVGFAISSK